MGVQKSRVSKSKKSQRKKTFILKFLNKNLVKNNFNFLLFNQI